MVPQRGLPSVLGAAIVAALLALSCDARAAPFRLIVTDLEPPLVPNSVMDLAAELGYFAREGVDVELVRVQQTPSALAALEAGEGEMANVSVDAVLQWMAHGQRKLKAVVSPDRALPFLIAARDDIVAPEDLAGRSFAIGRVGSLDHSLSSSVLRALGVDPGLIGFVALGQPAVRAQALAAGQVDATTMSVGVWMALPDRGALHVLVPQDAYREAAPVLQKVNVVPDAVLAERRDEVAAVVRGIINASRDFSSKPASWVEAMAAARPDVPRSQLEALVASFDASWSVNGGLDREEIDNTVAWLHEDPSFEGLRPPGLDEWVDFSVIDGVLAEIGTVPGDEPGR
jgi:NitT/TauT family transport system substrate-binding protein